MEKWSSFLCKVIIRNLLEFFVGKVLKIDKFSVNSNFENQLKTPSGGSPQEPTVTISLKNINKCSLQVISKILKLKLQISYKLITIAT